MIEEPQHKQTKKLLTTRKMKEGSNWQVFTKETDFGLVDFRNSFFHLPSNTT
jgi:hypothetical protein